MPKLNGKKYSYTKKGIAKYKKDKKRKGMEAGGAMKKAKPC